jgi:FtsP/CotA-like multicopper oxidase with cupredoxin domain
MSSAGRKNRATAIHALLELGADATIESTVRKLERPRVDEDGNPLPAPVRVPGLWLGTAERISAIVEMRHPGVWEMGDLADDDRHHGMGIVIEYAGAKGKPQWVAPKPFKWNYTHFGHASAPAIPPDDIFEMLFEKQNAASDGFNVWTINGVAYPADQMMVPASFHLRQGRRSRLRIR